MTLPVTWTTLPGTPKVGLTAVQLLTCKDVTLAPPKPTATRLAFEQRVEQAYTVVKDNPDITPVQLRELLGVSRTSVCDYLRVLINQGRVKYSGSTNNRTYRIKEKK